MARWTKKHGIGPSLAGVLGRQAGTAKGFKGYSPDMKAAGEKGLTWNEETLAAFVQKVGKKGPREYIGSKIGKKKAKIKMIYRGLKKKADVINLLAFIRGSGK